MVPNIRTLVLNASGAGFDIGKQPLLSAPFIASMDEMMFIAPFGCRTVLTAAGQGPILNTFCKRVQNLHVEALGSLATSWKKYMGKAVFERFIRRPVLRPVQDFVLDDDLESIFQVSGASQEAVSQAPHNSDNSQEV
eukprot:CAMPEP_0113676404 /NCGR_PEP_ID=MMETSP0038_2-20120614/8624_1 /TAXON_ID=2898 /ORGANISM="Cryptomonas paramecium" /LENGTH=136 /DNA_ID=CAMNT_0000593429 /DNA_START=570 /DNA_END=980 /DNA_ORIENTATION=- /assembly_acc=CAM_ASM_000170